ncbi:MAG TPA: SDR family oxidoreductase [Candidatus Brocadiaceae bacterium]|nr:SDR family oxidoreductase [Candidatus Woesearchaeota archaeon]
MINDLFSLDNKVVVITGAAGLLGRQHADAVAQMRGIPVLLDINADAVEHLAADIIAHFGVPASGWAVDITKEAEIEKNSTALLARYGHIDGLVNNAANNPKVEGDGAKNFSRLENFPVEVWQADMAVGLTGSFLCAKYYGSAIARNPQGGSIVNISSDLGLIAPDQRLYRKTGLPDDIQPVKPVTYSVVKSGLIGLTRYLATYWPNVRCNALCPGGVANNQDQAFLKEVCSRIPMGRLARPDEYQGAVLFLLSEASSYMTGAILIIDGGRSCW